MYEKIDEKIEVAAVFGKGLHRVTPFKIRWSGREYTIKKVNYVHKVKEGRKIIHVFSCNDDTNFFEIRFDAADLQWILGRVWNGETN